jgi:hypothetical protein
MNTCMRMRVENILQQSVANETARMNNSSSFQHYRKLRKHCRTQEFLDFHCNWSKTKAYVQLRANLSQITVDNRTTKLQSLCYFYDRKVSPVCKCCNLDKAETLYHALFECPRYTLIRSKYFSHSSCIGS